MPFLVEMLFTSISWLLMIVYLTMHQLLSFFNPILQLVTTGLSWWAWAFLYAPKLPLSVQIKHFISISKIYHIPPRKACHLGCRDEKKKGLPWVAALGDSRLCAESQRQGQSRSASGLVTVLAGDCWCFGPWRNHHGPLLLCLCGGKGWPEPAPTGVEGKAAALMVFAEEACSWRDGFTPHFTSTELD